MIEDGIFAWRNKLNYILQTKEKKVENINIAFEETG